MHFAPYALQPSTAQRETSLAAPAEPEAQVVSPARVEKVAGAEDVVVVEEVVVVGVPVEGKAREAPLAAVTQPLRETPKLRQQWAAGWSYRSFC